MGQAAAILDGSARGRSVPAGGCPAALLRPGAPGRASCHPGRRCAWPFPPSGVARAGEPGAMGGRRALAQAGETLGRPRADRLMRLRGTRGQRPPLVHTGLIRFNSGSCPRDPDSRPSWPGGRVPLLKTQGHPKRPRARGWVGGSQALLCRALRDDGQVTSVSVCNMAVSRCP